MNFLICSPGYTHTIAGVRVLHYLCHLINKSGHTCYVTSDINPQWNELRWNNENVDVTIYPEIYFDFLNNNSNIVRWCLNKPGLLGGPSKYSEKEMVWYYSSELKESAKLATLHMEPKELYLPSVEPEEFQGACDKDLIGCFWLNRESNMNLRLPFDNLQEITRGYPSQKSELIKLLKRSKFFYSYSNFTIMNEEALLCGCEVYIVNGDKWEKYTKENLGSFLMNDDTDSKMVNNFINDVKLYYRITHD